MGLDFHAVKFLLEARAAGADFESTATIGRQTLQVEPTTLRKLLVGFGLPIDESRSIQMLTEADGFCEPFFRLLGASEVFSIDASSYQQATLLQDLNQEIPNEIKNRFSAVVDGGSLEHVFNFPKAIANCMDMIRPGGHFIGISPANNFMGHGFYQFSPELFYRVFAAPNGFSMQRMIIYQDCWPDNAWHEVRDPEEVRRRVTLVNRYPTYILIQAQKHHSVPLFSPNPQQSDYVAMWQGDRDVAVPSAAIGIRQTAGPRRRPMRSRLLSVALKMIPTAVKRRFQHLITGGYPFDPALYRRIDR